MTILECKNILTAVMEPWIERLQYKLLSGQPRAERDEIFLSPYVLFLVVLTMKTNEAVGYQGCPIHLIHLYFPLPGPDMGSHWVVSPLIMACTGNPQSVLKINLQFTIIFVSSLLPACHEQVLQYPDMTEMRLDVSNLCVSPTGCV